jgi:hypothetical protein
MSTEKMNAVKSDLEKAAILTEAIFKIQDFPEHLYQIESFIRSLESVVEFVCHLAVQTKSTKELNLIRGVITDCIQSSGGIRFALKDYIKALGSILKGIDKRLGELGEKPQEAFYKPKSKDVVEDIKCPHCGKVNKKFKYGSPCLHCHELIADPWKEHTVCPKCRNITNTADIRSDIKKELNIFEVDAGKKTIKCPNCGKRFKWKEHVASPEAYGLKYCVYCDMPFIPDKRNWKTHQLCSKCKDKGIDLFLFKNPTYQKNYRKRKTKKSS